MENKKFKLLSKNLSNNKNKSFNNLLGFTPIYMQTQNKNNLPHFITSLPNYMAPIKTKLKIKKSPFKKIYTPTNNQNKLIFNNNNNSNSGYNNKTFTNSDLNNRSVTPPLIYKRERLLENKFNFNNNNNKNFGRNKLIFENKLVFEESQLKIILSLKKKINQLNNDLNNKEIEIEK